MRVGGLVHTARSSDLTLCMSVVGTGKSSRGQSNNIHDARLQVCMRQLECLHPLHLRGDPRYN
ncbi:hypothetical protein J6590_066401 [Homalodisca vitripennis]|nr:hypothetical protein J6590_066401 [Homalodisca vitripennis]